MNSTENSTGLPGFAMPRGDIGAAVDIDRLQKMSAYELWALQGSIQTIGDVLAGMLCQPKHFGSNDNYNLAGECLDDLATWIATYHQAVVNAAECAKPRSKAEAEWAAWAVLNFEVACTDDLASLAVTVANAVKDVQSAAFAEAHPK